MFSHNKNVSESVQSIRSREKNLRYEYELKMWYNFGDDISLVKDGLVNEIAWWDTPHNIMFIVKDINFPFFINDIREYLAEYFSNRFEAYHSEFVDCMLMWTHCIMHCESSMTWDNILSMMTEENNKWLLRQLAVLLSDVGYIHPDIILRKKLHIYNADRQLDLSSNVPITYPSVVICAGTSDILIDMDKYLKLCYKDYVSIGFDKTWNQTSYGINYIVIGETVYVDFIEPVMSEIKESSILLLKVLEEIQAKEKKLLTPLESIC